MRPHDLLLGTVSCHLDVTDDRVVITHADPRVLVSTELLDMIAKGYGRDIVLEGDLLKIVAKNRTVVYRIGEKTEDGKHYRAEWPD